MELHLLFPEEANRSSMSIYLKKRREQLQGQLLTELLRAEQEVDQALPEEQEVALQHYEKAVRRFSRLVVYRQLSGESAAR
jgi:hypothetical protein